MTRPKYVASCSGGKDSVATLLLAAQHNEPLDEAVFSEVMFDKNTSGEVPEHRDFIYDRLKPFCEKELGIKFTILHADKTYDEVFHHVISRGPHKGEVRGFAWAGMCAVNRDCKIPPVRKYNAALSPDTVSYVGIAEDEPKRLARLDGVKKVSLLAKYGMTEVDAYKLCQEHGLLSPKLLEKKVRGKPSIPVTGFRESAWVAGSHKLWKSGADVFLSKDGETFKELKAADYIPVGATLNVDGIKCRIEAVDFAADEVRLTNIEDKNRPIHFSESIQYVRSYVEDVGTAIYDTIPKKPAARESIRDKLKSAQKAQPTHTPKPQKLKGKDMVL